MKEIRFDRNYKKLHNQTECELCGWTVRGGASLQKDFIKYDTEGKYKIERNKEYMILFLVGNKMIPFTTLRSLNKNNLRKYNLGETYKIVVEEEK